MTFHKSPSHWVSAAIVLLAICTIWLHLSFRNSDRDGLALDGKRSPGDGKPNVFQAMGSKVISRLSEAFSFLPRALDFARLVTSTLRAQAVALALAQAKTYAHVGAALPAKIPAEVDHMSLSPDHMLKVRMHGNSWQGCFVAVQESTKSDRISNSEHTRENPVWSENPSAINDSQESLSQDGQEIHGLVRVLLARRKEGVGKDQRKKLLLAVFVSVIACALLQVIFIACALLQVIVIASEKGGISEVIFAALKKDEHTRKTSMKLVSEMRREDLLLNEVLLELREGQSEKNWSRNKTESALWNCKLPAFERNPGSLEFLFRLSSSFLPDSTTLWAVPASLGQFLPTVLSGQGNRFQYMGYRLASLAALPSGSVFSPFRLAEAGFHYNPEASDTTVVCHECGVTYRLDSNPVTTLPPLLHHQRASPNCSVARTLMKIYGSSAGAEPSGDARQKPRQQTDECEIQTDGAEDMPDAREVPGVAHTDNSTRAEISEQRMMSMAAPSQVFNGYTLALPSTSQDVQSYAGAMAVQSTSSGASSEKVYLDLNNAVYPLFSSLQSRLATFSTWPSSSFRPPELLAPLGFFYAGYADCVRCFYCGVGLKTWEDNDDPEEEHIRWRPNCQYVLATKGQRFVNSTLARINRSGSGNNTDEVTDDQNSTARDTRRVTTHYASSGESQRSAERHSPSGSLSSQDRQQLLQMGFSEEMISSTQAQLLSSGQTLTIENILAFLVP